MNFQNVSPRASSGSKRGLWCQASPGFSWLFACCCSEHSTHASPHIIFAHSGETRAWHCTFGNISPLFRSQCAVQSDIFCTFTNISSLYPHDLATPIALRPLGHFRIDHTTVSKWTHRSKLARKQIWLESCLQSVTTVSGCKTLWQVPIIGAKPLFSILRKSGGERLILHSVTMRSRRSQKSEYHNFLTRVTEHHPH